MAAENMDWDAQKIHGELRKLGFDVSERTVARYLQRVRRCGDPGKRWLGLPDQPSRSDCSDGFFHRAHPDVPGPVLLLCD
jgi:hypothetical protein